MCSLTIGNDHALPLARHVLAPKLQDEHHKIAIVVLNHNKLERVLACLESVSKLAYPCVEVVVVDNGSTDGSPTVIQKRFPRYHLIVSPQNLGAIRGRNLGVKYVEKHLEYDYVLFLDDDAEITPDALSVGVDWLSRHKDTGIVCGKTYNGRDSLVLMSAGIRANFSRALVYDIGGGEEDRGQFNEQKTVDACGAFAFLIRGQLLSDLKGFDELFTPYGWEDVDLCLRARQLGFLTTYLPGAVFSHKGTQRGRASIPMYEFSKARNFLPMVKRHATRCEFISCLLWLPYRAVVLTGRYLMRGELSIIFVLLRGLIQGLRQGLRQH